MRGDGTTGNLVQNLDSHGNYDPAGHGQNADGIAVKFGSGTGNRITRARLFDNSDDGLDLWQFSSPVTIEHSWAFGNGENRWSDPAFEGNGNGFKLGGGGASVAHVVNNNAAWDNGLHGFTENSNIGAIALNRNTAHQRPQRLLLRHRQGPPRQEPRRERQGRPREAGLRGLSPATTGTAASPPRPSGQRTRRARTPRAGRTAPSPRRRS
ncbi:hypothetical protein SAFG77S_11948 [Streptomyces afghaniensis]